MAHHTTDSDSDAFQLLSVSQEEPEHAEASVGTE